MLLAGTTFTELDQAASFWFALTDTWRGGAPLHLRPHTCSRLPCGQPPVTAPASTGPANLPSLMARTPEAVILISAGHWRPELAFAERGVGPEIATIRSLVGVRRSQPVLSAQFEVEALMWDLDERAP